MTKKEKVEKEDGAKSRPFYFHQIRQKIRVVEREKNVIQHFSPRAHHISSVTNSFVSKILYEINHQSSPFYYRIIQNTSV